MWASFIRENSTTRSEAQTCTHETKTCADGSLVSRSGPQCEFETCNDKKVEATSSLPVVAVTSTSTLVQVEKISSEDTGSKKTAEINTSTKAFSIKSVVTSVVNKVTSAFSGEQPSTSIKNYYPTTTIPPSTYITDTAPQNSTYKSQPPQNFAGEKYLVKDGVIVTNDNKVVYSIPQEVINNVSSSNPDWTNTIINVVPVGNVAPILNAIPITDLPGKYYLSQNSFGNIEACEFSNKIFILDTIADTATLMYEENSSTLSHDDPRACNSEIFLLTTVANNLLLKYHTIGTNTLCDSAWSEPEKTFYIDVTKLRLQGMMKYSIPDNLSSTAEQEEEACRAKL